MPTPDDMQQMINELEEKISVLRMENDHLAERAEDSLLLGLIAEQISSADGIGPVLDAGLERISVLKDIPFCACCNVKDNRAEIIRSYLSFSAEDINNRVLALPPNMTQDLTAAGLYLTSENGELAGLSLDLKSGRFTPRSLICIPFKSRYADPNIFIFADDKSDYRLPGMHDMLRRVIEMIIARIDNISLLNELRALNRQLDIKVEERTHDLLASESRFRQFFENEPDYCYMISPDGKILDVNKAALEIIGYSKEELIGRPVASIYAPESLPTVQENLRSWETTGKLVDVEMVIISKSGQRRTVLLSADAVRDDQGAIRHSISVQRDITERKLAQQKLLDSENRYRMLFNVMDEGVAINEIVRNEAGEVIDYRILEVNPAFTKNSIYSREQVEGQLATDLYQMSSAYIREWWKKHLEMLQVIQSEMHFEPLDRWFHIRTTPPIGDRFATFSEDITDQKRAENEKEELQAQLLQAQKMESVGRLAGGVAHDFNNMLSVILGYTELGLETIDPSQKIHDYLREVHKAGEHAADLTRQLLAFARKQTIQPKILDLNQTLANMLSMLQRLLGEDKNLIWSPGKDLWLVQMDPSQVGQILVNLCVNARDAISGVGEIVIATKNVAFDDNDCVHNPEVRPGDYVQLSIGDNGRGIAPEVLANIFEPFFTTKELGKGTGLGLSTVYGIVQQNYGFINVTSEVDQGTTFRIYLKRHSGKKDARKLQTHSREIPVGHGRILLVEDEPALLKLCQSMLQNLGYQVLTAGSPTEAIELAKSETGAIDLLLTDVIMPEMNGSELSRIMRSFNPTLKWLFMSGYTADLIAHTNLPEGDSGFIQKPFTIEELSTMVRAVLQNPSPEI